MDYLFVNMDYLLYIIYIGRERALESYNILCIYIYMYIYSGNM